AHMIQKEIPKAPEPKLKPPVVELPPSKIETRKPERPVEKPLGLDDPKKFEAFAKDLLSLEPSVRAEAEKRLSSIGDTPAGKAIGAMVEDLKGKKLYKVSAARGDKAGVERFIKFDLPKHVKERFPERVADKGQASPA